MVEEHRRRAELFDRLDERREELRQLKEFKINLESKLDGLMFYVNGREHSIKAALDVRTIIEIDEPQIASNFMGFSSRSW